MIRALAGVAGVVAVGLWIVVVVTAQRGPASPASTPANATPTDATIDAAPTNATPPDAMPRDMTSRHATSTDAAPAVDAYVADGVTVDVDFGVRFIVPRGYAHERVATSISIGAKPDVTFVVAVRHGERLKKLDAPIDGIVSLAKDQKLRIVSIITDGPNMTIGRLESTSEKQMIQIVSAPTYRVVIYLVAKGPHDIEPLVDEILHGKRLLLP